MSDIKAQRERVKLAYPGPDWDAKVAKMPDAQIAVLFKKFTNERKI